MLNQAAAQVWVRAGATGVVIAGRRKEVLDETVRSLESFNKGTTKILGIPTDITIEHDVENLFQQVNKAFGRPADVVIANAAVAIDLAPIAETKASAWWNVFVSQTCRCCSM
jgi:NAD(P)-dependent dehydrogenase (short-subunit alcohol dehydrogenase family)